MSNHGRIAATLELRYQAELTVLVELLHEHVDTSPHLRGRLISLTDNDWASLTVLARYEAAPADGLAALSAFHDAALRRLG